MSNNLNNPTIYGEPGNWDVPLTKLPSPGNLGQRITITVPLGAAPGTGPDGEAGSSKTYQQVQIDSGVGSSPTIGTIQFWRNKNKYLTTNAQSESFGQNHPAGVCVQSSTLGNCTYVQIKNLAYVQITAASQAALVNGDYVIASAADWGKGQRVAAGTAPTNTVIGIAMGPCGANGLALVDLNIPETT